MDTKHESTGKLIDYSENFRTMSRCQRYRRQKCMTPSALSDEIDAFVNRDASKDRAREA